MQLIHYLLTVPRSSNSEGDGPLSLQRQGNRVDDGASYPVDHQRTTY